MRRDEIGSEYWKASIEAQSLLPWDSWVGDKRFYVSGRTALDSILRDLLLERSCKNACIPSFCCESMILPFIKNGLSIFFYPVTCLNGYLFADLTKIPKVDIVLTIDYFGFDKTDQTLCPKDVVIIEDATHSLFGKEKKENTSYCFASLRKWGPISGAAVAAKRENEFVLPRENKQHTKFITKREIGYTQKSRYIYNECDYKAHYLDTFSSAEALLDNDNNGYAADPNSMAVFGAIATSDMIEKRRENVAFLLEALYGLQCVHPLFSVLKPDTCPLFFPVIVEKDRRNALQAFLRRNEVYCPIHWPLTCHHTINKEEMYLYEHSLSLLCDQRYTTKNMQRQVSLIEEFERTYA